MPLALSEEVFQEMLVGVRVLWLASPCVRFPNSQALDQILPAQCRLSAKEKSVLERSHNGGSSCGVAWFCCRGGVHFARAAGAIARRVTRMDIEVSLAMIAEKLRDGGGAQWHVHVLMCCGDAADGDAEGVVPSPAEDEAVIRAKLADMWRAYVIFEVRSWLVMHSCGSISLSALQTAEGTPPRVHAVYERALAVCYSDAGLWTDYARLVCRRR